MGKGRRNKKLKFKIRHNPDGTLECPSFNGRKANTTSARELSSHRPKPLCAGHDPDGKRKGAVSLYDVDGYLDTSKLRNLVDKVAERADAIERGAPTPARVEHRDFRTTNAWQRLLRRDRNVETASALPGRPERRPGRIASHSLS